MAIYWGRKQARAGLRQLGLFRAGFVALIATCIPLVAFGRQHSAPPPTAADHPQAVANASQAAKDVNVGDFYLHKGDYGAAISRLEEAVQLDPRDPKARLLLGESYEKQGNWTDAIKTYRDYLAEFPDAHDSKKIHKKIAELSRKRD
jgi:Tfp pilus assembly protein PilF